MYIHDKIFLLKKSADERAPEPSEHRALLFVNEGEGIGVRSATAAAMSRRRARRPYPV